MVNTMREGILDGWQRDCQGGHKERCCHQGGSVFAISLLCLCFNLGIWRIFTWGSGEQSQAQSLCSGNNPLSLLHSDMKSEKRAPSPDVIVLSDNEQPVSPRVNGLPKEALQETSTEDLMVSLVPLLGTTPQNSIPEHSW